MEKSELFSFWHLLVSLGKGCDGKKRCVWGSAASVGCGEGKQDEGTRGEQRMLCPAGSALQQAEAGMPGSVLVFTSEFGGVLSFLR